MFNKIILQGRCGSNPKMRMTASGIPVATVSLAVDRDFKSGDGNKETDWIDVVAWRGTAKFLSDYFTKGSMAVVSGRLQIRNWTDNDGNKRRSAEVVAENIYFGESKRDSNSEAPESGYVPSSDPMTAYPESSAYLRQAGFDVLPDDVELPAGFI